MALKRDGRYRVRPLALRYAPPMEKYEQYHRTPSSPI
jgi:hypothetical protein